jgi:predicted esterase
LTGEPATVRPHHLTVRKTARYFLSDWTGEPAVSSLWIVLHGYRQSAERFASRFEGLRRPDRLVVAPEGLSRFYVDEDGGPHGVEHRVGASWMTRVDREAEIADYVAYLDQLRASLLERYQVRGPRIIVLGFSQGSHTAARWALRGALAPDELVLWGAGLHADLDEALEGKRLRDLSVTIVRGRSDPLAPERLLRRERERMEALGVAARILEYDGGHEIEAGALHALASVVDPLTGIGES